MNHATTFMEPKVKHIFQIHKTQSLDLQGPGSAELQEREWYCQEGNFSNLRISNLSNSFRRKTVKKI
jgi:hypothetical protein